MQHMEQWQTTPVTLVIPWLALKAPRAIRRVTGTKRLQYVHKSYAVILQSPMAWFPTLVKMPMVIMQTSRAMLVTSLAVHQRASAWGTGVNQNLHV